MDWRERLERLQERLERPLPLRTASPREVARAVASLILGITMMLLGVPLLRGWIGADHTPRWWEFTGGFVLVGGSLYVVRWGLMSHERGGGGR